MRRSLVTLLFSIAACAASMPAMAADIDLHAQWDQRCAGCHGHSAEFARRSLRLDGDGLAGVHHRTASQLARFLRNHYLNDELVGPVSAMLRAQLETPPLYSAHCAGCHGKAAEFARTSLRVRDGVLVGTRSGRAVIETLARHGGLSADDNAVIVRSLTRVRDEVAPGAR